jgi:nucleoid DNA-binding protein
MAKKAAASGNKAAAPKAAAGGAKKAATKSQIYSRLAESTKLTKAQISAVLDGLVEVIRQDLSKKGPGVFTLPGLLKLRKVEKPATKERMGRNPRTGEEMKIPAKPKSTVVRARVLKPVQEMVK